MQISPFANDEILRLEPLILRQDSGVRSAFSQPSAPPFDSPAGLGTSAQCVCPLRQSRAWISEC